MDRSSIPTAVFIAFPFFFIGLWFVVLHVLALLGGWRRLAERFRAEGEPKGRRFYMQSGKVGWVNYNGCLTIYSSPEGLYLSVMLPFRLGHPPLFIPWSEVQNATTRRVLWTSSASFDVGSPRVARLQLATKVFEGNHALS